MRAITRTNAEMYASIPYYIRDKKYLINGEEYHLLKALRIARKLGLVRIELTEGRELNVAATYQTMQNIFKRRTYYLMEVHDRSRTTWDKCTCCGDWIAPNLQHEDYNGICICETCKDDDYYSCDNCGNLVSSDEGIYVEGGYNSSEGHYCPNCADDLTFTCSSCDRTYHNNERNTEDENLNICNDCFDENYFTCPDCGEVYHNDQGYYSERNECNYCEVCYDNNDSRCVNSYNYKPRAVFYGKAPYYFGIEIECEPNDIAFGDLAEAVEPIMYLKEDGSLGSEGVEIVSHPMSFDYIHNELDWSFLSDVRGWINDYGIHIHICRKAFKNQFHIEKVINFFAKEPDFIDAIAQRNSEQWAKKKRKKGIGNKRDRYTAVNQCNTKTIEFRIFQTSCRKDRVLKNIQFVDAIVQYTKEPILISEMDKESFTSYVNARKDRYPDLAAYIVEIDSGVSRMKR